MRRRLRARRRSSTNALLLAILGLVAGLGLGLLYAWVLSPVKVVDSAPASLRADYQAAYIDLIARAYRVDGRLEQARARLAGLGPAGSLAALATQASGPETPGAPAALSALATALATDAGTAGTPAGRTPVRSETPPSPTPAAPTPTPSPTARPTDTVVPTITPRPLPARTPTAAPIGSLRLVGRQQVCDAGLPGPLIQVITQNSAGGQVGGVEIVVEWDGGADHFYTGLKPELGVGYGDFAMTPGVEYSLRLGGGPSAGHAGANAPAVTGVTAPTCAGERGEFPGSWLIVFRQP